MIEVVEQPDSNTVDQVRSYLDRAGEQMGVTIRSTKYRARLRELLEETQQQAEELHAPRAARRPRPRRPLPSLLIRL